MRIDLTRPQLTMLIGFIEHYWEREESERDYPTLNRLEVEIRAALKTSGPKLPLQETMR